MDEEPHVRKPVTTTGSSTGLVHVLHTERRMRVYGVTENELRTLTIINLAVAFLFSLGTGFVSFGLDLHKDVLMTSPLPPSAGVLADIARPLAFLVGGAFYLAGGSAWWMRRGFIEQIKQESKLP